MDGAENVARAAAAVGARLVHLSTDVVFDGRKGEPYVEEDEPCPATEYGRAKAEAELRVRAAHPAALLVRTSLIVGGPGHEPSKHELAAREPRARSTRTRSAAPCRWAISRRHCSSWRRPTLAGPLHVAGPDAVSRAELAELVRGRPVRRVPRRPGRPLDCRLDCSRARADAPNRAARGTVGADVNRLADATSPYLLQHAENPVDWHQWGDEALARGSRGGQADPALGRLQLVPLVPRDGARVVRGRGHRGVDERALRQRQGRPRGAARRRRRLHGRHAGDDGPRRLADDRLPDSRGRAVLRGHVLPAGAEARDASFRAGADRGRGGVARAPRRRGAAGGPARRRAGRVGARRRLRPSRSPRTLLAEAERGIARTFEPSFGGFGRAPKFPPASTIELLLRRDGEQTALEMVAATLDGDGRRRHVRPRRRGLPPLLGRRPLARSALREDALRQRAARLRVPARLGRHGPRPVADRRRGDARLPAPRARAARRRARVRAGRRHGGRRRPDLHVEPRTRRTRPACPASCCSRSSTAARSSAASSTRSCARGCWRCGSAARSRSATTRRSPPGTGSRSRRSPRAAAGWSATTGSRPRARRGSSCSGPLSREDGRLLRSWRQGRASGEGYLDDYANVGARAARAARRNRRAPLAARGSPPRASRRRAVRATSEHGGFLLAPRGGEALVAATKPLDDNPIPSGNSMLAHVLLRLGRIWGDDELERRRRRRAAARRARRCRRASGQRSRGRSARSTSTSARRASSRSSGAVDAPVARAALAAVRADDRRRGRARRRRCPCSRARTSSTVSPPSTLCERFTCRAPDRSTSRPRRGLMRLALMIEGQEGVSWEDWLRLARACEEHGVEALFRSDHYGSILTDPWREAHDAWATINALGATTERVRLGTLVSPATFRHPSVLARMATTADHVSNGRVEVGMGAGWYEREHDAHGFAFGDTRDRFERFAEQVEIVVRSWTEDGFDFEGRHYRLRRRTCRAEAGPAAASAADPRRVGEAALGGARGPLRDRVQHDLRVGRGVPRAPAARSTTRAVPRVATRHAAALADDARPSSERTSRSVRDRVRRLLEHPGGRSRPGRGARAPARRLARRHRRAGRRAPRGVPRGRRQPRHAAAPRPRGPRDGAR